MNTKVAIFLAVVVTCVVAAAVIHSATVQTFTAQYQYVSYTAVPTSGADTAITTTPLFGDITEIVVEPNDTLVPDAINIVLYVLNPNGSTGTDDLANGTLVGLATDSVSTIKCNIPVASQIKLVFSGLGTGRARVYLTVNPNGTGVYEQPVTAVANSVITQLPATADADRVSWPSGKSFSGDNVYAATRISANSEVVPVSVRWWGTSSSAVDTMGEFDVSFYYPDGDGDMATGNTAYLAAQYVIPSITKTALNSTNGIPVYQFDYTIPDGSRFAIAADAPVWLQINKRQTATDGLVNVFRWVAAEGVTPDTHVQLNSAGADYVEYPDALAVSISADQCDLEITGQPAGAAGDYGESATFSVEASGGYTPYTYQWELNGSSVSGATSSVLDIDPITSAEDGDYTVVVTPRVCSAVESSAAELDATNPIHFDSDPVSLRKIVGQTAVFSGTPSVYSGCLPITNFVWEKNGTVIAGATLSSLTLNPVSTGDAGSYVEGIIDSCVGGAISGAATLTVAQAVGMSSPTSATAYVGDNRTFSSSATGGFSPYTYQWYVSGTSAIAGQTFTVLAKLNVQTTDSGNYTAKGTDAETNTGTSSAATLNVQPHLTIPTPPTGENKYVGETAGLNFAIAGGFTPFTYSWYKDGTTSGFALAGSTDTAYTKANLQTSDDGTYYANAADSATDSVFSAAAALHVHTAVDTTDPTPIREYVGGTATFSSVASGGFPPYQYQWYKGTVSVGTGSLSYLTLTPLGTADAADYNIMSADSLTSHHDSEAATLSVEPVFDVSVEPVATRAYNGDSPVFSTTLAGGYTPYTYQWNKGGSPILNATLSTLTLATVTTADEGNYSADVGDDNTATDATSSVALDVNPHLAFSTHPVNTTEPTGGTATFTCAVIHGFPPYTYQWYKGGTTPGDAIAGATLTSLTLTNLGTADAASYWAYSEDDNTDTKFSDEAILTVSP